MSLITSPPSIDLGHRREALLVTYYSVIVLGGQIGLPMVLATVVLGNQPRRHPTFLNILLAWVFYATASLLLFYSGDGLSEHPHPSFSLCLGQAALVYGGTILVGTANLALVVQLWLEFRGSWLAKNSKLTLILLLGVPWLSFLGFFIFSLVLGARNPSLVSIQWVFYCTISSDGLINTVSGATMVLLAIIVFFEASIVRMLYRSSRQIRAVNQSSYNLSIRVTGFTIYSLVTFIVSGVLTFRPTTVFPYMFTGSLPLAAFLIFGTQPENLRTWCKICLRSKLGRKDVRLDPITFKPGRLSGSSPRSSHSHVMHTQTTLEKRLPPTPTSASEIV